MSTLKPPSKTTTHIPARPPPPLESTTPDAARAIASKFVARSRVLASDSFVYDIQDEPSRSNRATARSAAHGQRDVRGSTAASSRCLVYKCVNDAQFENWIRKARAVHGHRCLNIMERPALAGGPTTKEAMACEEDLGRVLRLRVHPGAPHGRVRATGARPGAQAST